MKLYVMGGEQGLLRSLKNMIQREQSSIMISVPIFNLKDEESARAWEIFHSEAVKQEFISE